MKSIFNRKTFIISAVIVSVIALVSIANANNSWGGYHWARTANPFTLKIVNNTSTVWHTYLGTTSTDWSLSNVLDMTVVLGSPSNSKTCKTTNGLVSVCNGKYGFNGWLGVAQVWVSGSHITQGTVKVNDSYFNTATYNTPAWRNLVMCQEVGHTLGLDHQDINFNNANLGTCMDYTNDPTSNQHPNQHDYDMLETIYSHLDTSTTIKATSSSNANVNVDDQSGFGRVIQKDNKGKPSLYERDFGKGEKVFTFIIWIE